MAHTPTCALPYYKHLALLGMFVTTDGTHLTQDFQLKSVGVIRVHSLCPTVLWILTCISAAAATAKSLQSYPTLCDPIDGSPPGSSVPGILQERVGWSGVPFPSPMHESEK